MYAVYCHLLKRYIEQKHSNSCADTEFVTLKYIKMLQTIHNDLNISKKHYYYWIAKCETGVVDELLRELPETN